MLVMPLRHIRLAGSISLVQYAIDLVHRCGAYEARLKLDLTSFREFHGLERAKHSVLENGVDGGHLALS
jgi:hypothetical protein